MKTRFFFTLCLICLITTLSSAQWNYSTGQITTTDKVDIGNDLNVTGTGHLGIGITANTASTMVVKANDWSDWIQLRSLSHGFWAMHNPQYEDRLSFYYQNASGVSTFDVLNLMNNGSVAIGSNCVPIGYKLAVKGKIICEELLVKLEGGNCWADFVFNKDYKLRSLSEVEQFIYKNRHLPDVPSATEVEEQGLSVTEMMTIQMRKIEELTLYMIELKKENDLLKQKVEILSANK